MSSLGSALLSGPPRSDSIADLAPRDPNCRFCQIIAGDEAAHLVFEDERSIAFLDNRPLFPGHSLLVPREHHETLGDLPDELIGPLFANARLLSVAVPKAMRKPGSFVALNNVVSQSVPHLHVHVVPRKAKDGLRGFFWPRTKYASEAEMRKVAERVRRVVEKG
jgi:histidine triad (HIT) family protein